MPRLRAALTRLAGLLLAGTAAAQDAPLAASEAALLPFDVATLPVVAPYGDEAGCARAAGEAAAGDSAILLDEGGISLHETRCEAAALHPLRDGAFVVLAACQAEGTREVRSYTLVPDAEYLSLTLHASDGRVLGTVRPCG